MDIMIYTRKPLHVLICFAILLAADWWTNQDIYSIIMWDHFCSYVSTSQAGKQ